MKKRLVSFVLSLFVTCSALPVSVFASDVFEKEWIVEFDSEESAGEYISTRGGKLLGGSIVLTHDYTDVLRTSGHVVSLTENSIMEACETKVSDPEFEKQLYLKNTPDDEANTGVDALKGWESLQNYIYNFKMLSPENCETIRVAVIDSGIDGTHEDLYNRVVSGYDVINQQVIPASINSDVSGHGTAVAGLIGAETNNINSSGRNIGIAGSAYTFPVKMIPVAVLNDKNKAAVSDIVSAIYWSVDNGKADIINMSFGESMNDTPAALQTAVSYALNKGVTLIAAAGNGGKKYVDGTFDFYPPAINGVLAVGSLQNAPSMVTTNGINSVRQPEIADFSNRPMNKTSPLYDTGFYLLPGENILSTALNNKYQEFNGTSASCALLSGFYAAMLSATRTVDGSDARRALVYKKNSNISTDATRYFSFENAGSYVEHNNYRNEWVRFTKDIPALVDETITIEGVFSDVGNEKGSIDLVLTNKKTGDYVTAVSCRRNDSPVQYFEMTLDPSVFVDGTYQWSLCSRDESGYLKERCRGSVIIDKEQNYQTARLSCNNEPFACDYEIKNTDGKVIESGTTTESGEFCIRKSLAEDENVYFYASSYVDGKNIKIFDDLSFVSDGVINIVVDPVSFTVSSGELFERLKESSADAYVSASGKENDFSFSISYEADTSDYYVSASFPLTCSVSAQNMYLKHVFDFDEDTVWDLQNELEECGIVEVEPDGVSYGCLLQLESAGSTLYSASKESSGSYKFYVSEGTYDLKGCPVINEDNGYLGEKLGKCTVEKGQSKKFETGCEASGEMTISPASPKENSRFSISYSFKDNKGRYIDSFGEAAIWNGNGNVYDNGCSFYLYQNGAEVKQLHDEITENENGIYVSGFSTENTEPGNYILKVSTGGILPDISGEITIRPEESRPYAEVSVRFDFGDGMIENGKLYTSLTDDENNKILRECLWDDDTFSYYSKLPVGRTYESAAVCYYDEVFYFTKADIDLTDQTAGERVTVTVKPGNTNVKSVDAEDFESVSLYLKPFADLDKTIVSENWCREYCIGDYENTPVIISAQTYDDGNEGNSLMYVYEMMPDFSDGEAISLGKNIQKNIKTDKESYKKGDTVKVSCDFEDEFGNRVCDIRKPGYILTDGTLSENYIDGESLKASFILRNKNGVIVKETESTIEKGVSFEGLEEGSYSVGLSIDGNEETPIAFAVGSAGSSVSFQKAPLSFSAKLLENDSVKLFWTAPDGGCQSYKIMRDGKVIASPENDSLSFTDTDTEANRYYVYEISAVSADGAVSSVRTAGIRTSSKDTEPPTVPKSIKSEADECSVAFSWGKSTDNSAVAGYIVSVNGEEKNPSVSRNYRIDRYVPGEEVIFKVCAVDPSGNRSEYSEEYKVNMPSETVVSNVRLDVKKNRLGVATDSKLSITANSTADVTSAEAEVKYTDSEGEKTITFDMTDDGSEFVCEEEMPFYKSIDKVTVHGFKGSEQSVSADYSGVLPLKRAGYLIVTLKDDPNDAALDLSDCTVTVSSKQYNYAASKTVSGWNADLTFDISDGNDYEVTVLDKDGVLLYSQTGISSESTIVIGTPDCMMLSVNSSLNFEGQTVTVFDSPREKVIANGVVNNKNKVVFSEGRQWFKTDKNESYSITFDKFELKSNSLGSLRFDSITYTETASKGIIRKNFVPAVYSLTNQTYKAVVTLDNEPVKDVIVNFATSHGSASEKTDANGTASVSLPFISSSLCTASAGTVKIGDKTYYAEDVLIRPDDNNKIIVLKKCLSPAVCSADIKVSENGTEVSLKNSELKNFKARYYLNGCSGYENAEGKTVFDDITVKNGDSLTLKVTLSDKTKEYSASKTVTADLKNSIVDFGEIVFSADSALVTVKANNSVSSNNRFLVYSEITGEKLSDETSSDRVTFTVPSQTSLAIFATAELSGDFTLAEMKNKVKPVVRSFSDGEKATVSADPSPLGANGKILLDSVRNFSNGFLEDVQVTWVDSTNVWVSLKAAYTPNIFEELGQCNTKFIIPLNAYDISVNAHGHEGADYVINTSGSFKEISFEKDAPSNGYDNMFFITIGFMLDTENEPDSFNASQVEHVDNEGRSYEFSIANKEISLSPVEISVPARISKSDAVNGLDVSLSSKLSDETGWIISLYDGNKLVYSSDLDKAGSKVNVPVSDTLHTGDIYSVVSKDNRKFISSIDYEVVDDSRPVLTEATVFGSDILDTSSILILKNITGDCTARAVFKNSGKVENVRLAVHKQNQTIEVPMEYSSDNNCFLNRTFLISVTDNISGFEILWDEKTDSDTVWGEISSDGLGKLQLSIPEGTVFEALPEEFGGDQSVEQQRIEKWNKYLEYLENDSFNNCTAEEEKTLLRTLFDDDGYWYLPTYKTSDGDYAAVYFQLREEAPEKSVSALVDGEVRKVYSGLSVDGNKLNMEIYGFGSVLFPTEKTGEMSAQWSWLQEKEKFFRDVKAKDDLISKGIDYIKVGKELKNIDMDKREDLDKAVDDLTGFLPYGDANEDVSYLIKRTMDVLDDKNSLERKLLCESGDLSYCDDDSADNFSWLVSSGGNSNGSDKTNSRRNGRRLKGTAVLLDPSGYVFEVTENERLEGVTATIYQQIGSSWYKWDSETYKQPANPSVTDSRGSYGWDTLAGKWKVVFEKDGYFTAESEILEVPPEHFDVNISMMSAKAPSVAGITAFKDGKTIRLEFDKYMTAESVTAENMAEVFFGSEKLDASVIPCDAVRTRQGNKQNNLLNAVVPDVDCAKVFNIVLDEEMPAGSQLTVKVNGEVMGYNFMALGEDKTQTLIIPENDPVIPAKRLEIDGDALITASIGDTADASEKLNVIGSGVTEKVVWTTGDPDIASVDENGVITAVKAGDVLITASTQNSSAVFFVKVMRSPQIPSETENKVQFCRKENLVEGKRCWLTSESAGCDNIGLVDGDARYIPVSWQIEEDGVVKASDTVSSDGEVQVPYYPEKPGADCKGSVRFRKQIWSGVSWTDTDEYYTASVTLKIVKVVDIIVTQAPEYKAGDRFNFSDLILGIKMSDGKISEIGQEKFESYGISLSVPDGKILDSGDSVLKITHSDTQISAEYTLFEKISTPLDDAKYFASLTLNESVDINFAVRNTGSGFDISKLSVKANGNSVIMKKNGNDCEGIIASVPAAKMGKNYNVVVSYDGVVVKVFDYSAKKYCDSAIEANNDSSLVRLCIAALNYGAAAQVMTGESVNDPVNRGVETDLSEVKIQTGTDLVFASNESITGAMASLMLDSRTALIFKFITDETLDVSDFTIRNEKNQTPLSENISLEKVSDGYCLTIKNLGADKLAHTYTVSVKGVSISFSAYDYCAAVLKGNYENSLKDLCRALYLYGEAASEYVSDRI